ncbi:MAG: Mov34/MPN/PAD-1 family protein [Wenzhouxiangellaceae bacterium]
MTVHDSRNSDDPVVLVFPSVVLRKLAAISEQARPREGAAALYGISRFGELIISSARRIANKARSYRQFIVDSQDLDGAIAFFHSHPISRTFSAQDRKQIIRSRIPWVIGFPQPGRFSSRSDLRYGQWKFQAARGDERRGFQPCKLFMTQEET